jgi:hypothetical protein
VVLTDQCTAATVTHRFDQLEATAFGDTDRKYVKGLGNHEVTLSLYLSYSAGDTYATLQSLVGTTTTVRVQPTSGGDSATNPGFILTGAFLAELPVINATMGELSTVDVTFVGGVYSTDTTA